MDSDDDIAESLPRPPLPAPARREAAIEEALRRFDGGGERPRAPANGRRAERPAPWRGLLDRPWAGALAGALLVALVGLPVAWISLGDRLIPHARAPAASEAGRAKSSDAATATATADAAQPATPAVPSSPRAGSIAAPPSVAPPAEVAGPAAAPAGIAPPAPPPPPPPPPAERSAKTEDAVAGVPVGRVTEPPALAGSNVTASRIARQAVPAAPSAAASDSAVIVTGTRVSRRSATRGDWNACTVDDPGRSLDGCRKLVDPAKKGAAGQAAERVADGLSHAWEGDYAGAIGAFGQAIAIAPRSSFAYLNRGLAYRRSGDLDRALADLDRAVRYAPGAARAYYNRGLVLRQRGDARRARADQDRAADLDPRYAELAE